VSKLLSSILRLMFSSSAIVNLLADSPLLLLFIVLASGALLGKLRIAGIQIGIAAVLFTGLAFGSLSADIKLPAIIYEIGLVIFIYCIGISSGEQFFGNLKKRKTWRESIAVVGVLTLALTLVATLGATTTIKYSHLVGVFAGSLTNTPALAASVEFIKGTLPSHLIDLVIAEPVVAYSVCYPMGIIGVIASILLFQKLFKTSLNEHLTDTNADLLTNATAVITHKSVIGKTIRQIKTENKLEVVFGRIKRNDSYTIILENLTLESGDLMTIVGKPNEVERAIEILGERSEQALEMNHQELDMRRVFVSNHEIIGQKLRDLNLPHSMGVIITRIRRGDSDILPHAETTLQFGDRVRILTSKQNLALASKFFGDSYAAQSQIDILTLGLGIAAGFFLGMIPIPLPGGLTLKLGIAGGPLVVALILGAINRVGKLVFVMPYSANHTIRQLGLVLFLAGIGTRSGFAFRETLTQSNEGVALFLVGAVITVTVTFTFLLIGHKFLKIPFPRLTGMMAGIQTQPAVLAFVNEQSKSDQPNIGYTSVFPIAMLIKIIFAQVLLMLLM
jgi:putative transport protein